MINSKKLTIETINFVITVLLALSLGGCENIDFESIELNKAFSGNNRQLSTSNYWNDFQESDEESWAGGGDPHENDHPEISDPGGDEEEPPNEEIPEITNLVIVADSDPLEILVGSQVTLKVEAEMSDGSIVEDVLVQWASSNENILTINQLGLVSAFSSGEVTISASTQGFSANLSVIVLDQESHDPDPLPPTEPVPPAPAPAPTPTPTPQPPVSGQPNFEFYSDWSTYNPTIHASNDFNAIIDSDKSKPWPFLLNNGDLADIVESSKEGLDFPTQNVLKITAEDHGSGFVKASQPQIRSSHNYVPSLNIGDSLYYRYYIRLMVPDAYTADNLTHGTQDADGFAQRNWQHTLHTKTNGTYELRIAVGNGNNSYPDNQWRVILNKFQTYRIEQQVKILSNSQFEVHVKIYDVNGQLVFTDSDFKNMNGTKSLAAIPAPAHNFGGGVNHLKAFRTGLNSLKGASNQYPFTFAYIGGVAICTNSWCGPYEQSNK